MCASDVPLATLDAVLEVMNERGLYLSILHFGRNLKRKLIYLQLFIPRLDERQIKILIGTFHCGTSL